MSKKYLLPCPCGRQTVIEPRQAGQTVRCGCGASLPTPTLLDMGQLEPAPQQSVDQPHQTEWGFGHGLRTVGVLLLLVGLAGETWLLFHSPQSRFQRFDPEQIQRSYQTLPAARSWQIWQQWKQGLDRRIDQQYDDALKQYRLGQFAFAIVALGGVALIVAPAILCRSDARHRSKPG